MNILLFNPEELDKDQILTLSDERRHIHLHKVIKPDLGDRVRVGQINGKIGTGKVIQHHSKGTKLAITLTDEPPPALPLKLLLAVPRPKMLRRILQTCATLGVAEIKLINSAKVEKSYWQTPFLQPEQVHENLLLGMEQGGLTHLPRVSSAKLFKPFVEDDLATWAGNTQRFVAHPRHAQDAPATSLTPTTLAIGPEGGFSDYEVDKLAEQGFTSISLGSRILRVETAIPVAIAQLMKL